MRNYPKLAIFLIIFSILLILMIYYKTSQNKIDTQKNLDENDYKQNIIVDVEYKSVDDKGNEYVINAKTGEIDYDRNNTIFLSKVSAKIILNDLTVITINSDYGKYNTFNYDTIFSKNVVIKYIDNKITSEYMDFSIARNTMIISKDVIYKNLDNIIKADVLEIKIDSKDAKIFMYEQNQKVNVKSKKFNGNN